MIVKAERLERWRKEVTLAAQDAELAARSEVAVWLSGHPECTVEEAREAAIKSVEKASASYCRISSATSGRLYEELAKEQGANAKFKVVDTTDAAYTEERARWCAGLLRNGDRAGFADGVSAVAGQQVRRNAVASMEENCRRSKVRWARVPTGRETCSWCFMLASRGFSYKSAQSAQAGWHRGCDCAVVPDFDGETQVEGYDPDGLYSRWKMCADTVQLDPLSDAEEVTKAIMRECDTRDPQWLWTGKVPEAVYEKPIEALEEHEKSTIEKLTANGIAPTVLMEDGNAPANIDLLIGGQLWEMKDAGDGRHSIEDRMRDSLGKWKRLGISSPVRTIITNEHGSRSMEHALSEIKRRMRYADEVLYIHRDGSIRRIMK